MAINKPSGYDEVQAGGDYTPIKDGGHKLVIKQVTETTSRSGRDMLVVEFDTTADDVQPNFYSKAYKADTRDNKKWGGVAYVMPTDMQGRTSKQFKGFCTSIERSNPGFKIVWGDKFCDALKDKLAGGVFGMEEYLNNYGEKRESHKLFWWRSIEGIEDARVPEPRLLEDDDDFSAPTVSFAQVDDDDIPF